MVAVEVIGSIFGGRYRFAIKDIGPVAPIKDRYKGEQLVRYPLGSCPSELHLSGGPVDRRSNRELRDDAIWLASLWRGSYSEIDVDHTKLVLAARCKLKK